MYGEPEHTLKKILFICRANVCRSPMGQTMFDALAEDRGLVFETGSAGVAALDGSSIDPKASAALGEIGFYPKAHRARQVTAPLLEDADLVLAMSPRHIAELHRLSGSLPREVHLLSEYATGIPGLGGVPDPHGHAMFAYRASARQLYEYIERVLDRLEQ